MKTQGFRGVCKLVVYATLLVGMAYSALGVTSKPVYASSCDCDSDDVEAAFQYCVAHGGHVLGSFVCPWEDNYFEFWCVDGGGPYYLPCQ
jgi:hypothetical protein